MPYFDNNFRMSPFDILAKNKQKTLILNCIDYALTVKHS